MATSSTSGVTIDDLKAKHGQLRSEHASLQTQLESLRQLPADATIDAVHTALELDNDELGRELREIEERAILYRSLAWTCFELDLDVGRRARAARRGDGAAAPVDKDGNLGFGVRLDTFWNGRFYEPYYLVLARPSQLLETSRLASTTTGDAEPASLSDELRLIRHTVPHFIPLERLVEKYLPSVLGGGMSGGSASRSRDSGAGGLTMLAQFSQLPGINAFLSDLHCHLQAYVSRRQQAASLQRLRLPGSSGAGPDQRPSLEALGTEAFDLIKITWHLPSPRQLDEAPAQTGQQVTDADAAASSLGATKRKRGLVDRDESAKSLVVTVGFSDLQSERLVDERRPKGILPNASGGGGGGGGGGDGGGTDPDGSPPDPVQGSKLPYGQVRIEILEYPPEAETRERRSAGISHADILALEPRSTRRQDLEVQFAEQHDGESSDLDKAFQHIAASVWRQESGSASVR
ncbi:hypothetical protein BCV70DRAFT_80381 [Testicularia cyperi]|uniref:Uncharacterized protein n=1 Tax=Testicularia cyperi TaxID=1882483 RepID=A0A317XH13_9BASI|nr:hypothetical protein BCV70DRAFT_80381 [Testicularia cyperi]